MYECCVVATRAVAARVDASAADKAVASIRRTIKRLQEMPSLGKRTSVQGGVFVVIEPDYRYCVFYKVDAHDVVVVRIVHARQA